MTEQKTAKARIRGIVDRLEEEWKYIVEVQIRQLGMWRTVWKAWCPYGDADHRGYIDRCAEEVYEELTEQI